MPRPPRVNVPNGIYHVTSRGNRGQDIFRADRDHDLFLALLTAVIVRCVWSCHGYCLMPNHYHLVVQTPNADLSLGMQRLNGEYAHYFNYVHDKRGHLFQGRFHAVLVESDWHFAELSRYLALNPVRAGLVEAPEEWRWSSYRAMADGTASPPLLRPESVFAFFGRDRDRARRSFMDFVCGGSPGAT